MAEQKRVKKQVDIVIKCNGAKVDIDPDIDVRVRIEKRVNKVSRAFVTLIMRRMPISVAFEYSEKDGFKPGKKIQISAGYQEEATSVLFDGIIANHRLSRDEDNEISIELECAHKVLLMTTTRNSAIFKGKDNAIISKICRKYGISASVDSTRVNHKDMVQYLSSDWDFVNSRAQANGLISLTNSAKLEIKKPKLSGASKIEVVDREGIISFSTSLAGINQFKSVEAKTWDYASQKTVKSSSGRITDQLGGDVKSSTLARDFNKNNLIIQSSTKMPNDELKAWAQSKMTLSKLSRTSGTIVIYGNGKIQAGDLVKLKEISKRFNGNSFVGGVIHTISLANWETELQLGYDFTSYFEDNLDVSAPEASGLLPAVDGLQTGKVISLGKDKNGQYRVQVKLSGMVDKSETIFARIASFYATNKSGSFFMPEKDDEVVIGFIGGDPRNAIILGSLYSSKKKTPLSVSKRNQLKAIVTKSKLKLLFNEKDKSIVLQTPGGSRVTLNDKKRTIDIKDSNNNKISMSRSGITISSMRDLKLSAKGQVKISSLTNATVDAKAALQLKGLTVKADAKTAFQAKGNAACKIQAAGIMQIQGALVKIN